MSRATSSLWTLSGIKRLDDSVLMKVYVLNATKIERSQAGPLFQSQSAVHISTHLLSLPTTWLTIQVQAEVYEKAGTSVACAF
jgi:hypothetical protein